MPSLIDDVKAILTGLKVTLENFKQDPVTVHYPWEYDKLPPNSRGSLRMVDFHDEESIKNKSDWYPGTRWAPCTETCPAHTDARGYVTLAAEGKWKEGLDLLRRTYPFVGTLGRICPAPCEKGCSRAFTNESSCAIRNIKRTIADWELQQPEKDRFDYEKYCCSTPLNGHTVGIVGAGPAGYQCAMLLRLFGFEVHMYEAKSMPGGFLTQAIPAYRLPRDIVNNELKRIHSLPGVTLHLNTEIGKTVSFEDLEKKHDEIIIASGAWKPYRLGLENEKAPLVYFGEDFLEQQINGKITQVPDSVVVVGGGNTGFDCARTCRRLGADVTMIYRRTIKEMPSEQEEIEDGQEEGVKLEWLTSPKSLVVKDGQLQGIEVVKNRLGEKDSSGRRSPVVIEGSERIIPCGMVITALGRQVELPWLPKDVKQNRNGTICVDKKGATTRDKVWACGDVVKVATVVAAIGGADRAVLSIAEKYQAKSQSQMSILYPYSKEKMVPFKDGSMPTMDAPQKVRAEGLGWVEPIAPPTTNPRPEEVCKRDRPFMQSALKAPLAKIDGKTRLSTFDEVSSAYTLEEAGKEANRCFGCSAEMCVGCGVCVETCPDACIYLDSQKSSSGRNYPFNYAIDFTRCCFCGLCTEACPTKSLSVSSNFELSVYDKRDNYIDKNRIDLGLVRKERKS